MADERLTYTDYGFDAHLNKSIIQTKINDPVPEISDTDIRGGQMVIGAGDSVYKADANGLYLGSAEFSSAPFRVTPEGVLTATGANISGSITASSFHIPDENTTVNSWHVDTKGNVWWGCTHNSFDLNNNNAVAYVLKTGIAKFKSITLSTSVVISGLQSGSDLDGQYLTNGSVASGKANLALRGWTQTCVFSASDADTVAWGAGTFTASDGTAYSIGAGNTGNMVARTYIYLDIAVSTTAYQTTTTAATAVGNGKCLVAVAENGTSVAEFQVFGGIGGIKLSVADLAADSTVTNEFVANTANIANAVITDAKIADLAVSKLTAGSITSKAITLAIAAGTGDSKIQAGKTDFTTTESGFIIGIDDSDSDKPKAYFGTSTDYFYYDGTNLVSSNLILTHGFTAGENVTANDALGLINIDQVQDTDNNNKDLGTTSNEKVAQSFQTALTGVKIHGITFHIGKGSGTITDNLYVTLEADSAGAPSGIPLATSQDVSGISSTTPSDIEFVFSTPYALTASTSYWLVVQRDGALDNVNYFNIRYQGSNVTDSYTSGVMLKLDDGSWSNDTGLTYADCNFRTFIVKAETVYQIESDYETLVDGFVGFARATTTSGNTVEVQLTGLVYKSSWGLTEGKQYYLTDTAGAIGLTAGTFSKKVGKALTTEKLLIDKVVD